MSDGSRVVGRVVVDREEVESEGAMLERVGHSSPCMCESGRTRCSLLSEAMSIFRIVIPFCAAYLGSCPHLEMMSGDPDEAIYSFGHTTMLQST